MCEILTPKEVAAIRRWDTQDADLNKDVDDLCNSHEALRSLLTTTPPRETTEEEVEMVRTAVDSHGTGFRCTTEAARAAITAMRGGGRWASLPGSAPMPAPATDGICTSATPSSRTTARPSRSGAWKTASEPTPRA